MTFADLLSLAESNAVLTPGESAAAREWARRDQNEGSMPWYLHAIVTVGAWISAGFMLLLLGVLFSDLFQHKEAEVAVGVGMIAAATLGRYFWKNVFLEQGCLALSVAGHGMFFAGIANFGGDEVRHLFLAAWAAAAALYFFYPDRMHRFLSTLTALLLLLLWLYQHQWDDAKADVAPVRYAVVLLQVGLLTWIFGQARARVAWRPFGYAIIVSLVALLAVSEVLQALPIPGPRVTPERWLYSAGIVLATLLSAGGWQRARRQGEVWLCLLVALAVMAGTASPATLLALFFLVLGFGLQDRALLVFGTLLLPGFLVLHYYSLERTLLYKSLALMATGAVLLALRFALARVRWVKEAQP